MDRGLFTRVVLAAAIGLGAVAVPAGFEQTPLKRVRGFDQAQSWFQLVRSHEIGQWDESARATAKLSSVALQRIGEDVHHIGLLLNAAAATGEFEVAYRGRVLRLDQLGSLMGLTPEELALPLNLTSLAKSENETRRAIGRVMMRAVLLHTQVALASRDDVVATPTSLTRPGALAQQMAQPTAIQIRDGRQVAVVNVAAIHWAIARDALDTVGPAPAFSPLVGLWYRATSECMQVRRNYALLQPHLLRARQVLPFDARIYLLSGVAHENLAVASAMNGGNPAELLAQAEQSVSRAMELDSGVAHAPLHLGRILDLEGRHGEAVTVLRAAETDASTPAARYYAALFLGQAEEAQGFNSEARAAFERAMGLFPRAQSPRLALADLVWRVGDSENAVSAVRTLFVVSAGAGPATDPWWEYDISHLGDVEALLVELFRAAAEAVR